MSDTERAPWWPSERLAPMHVTILYRNHRGKVAHRRILPQQVRFDASEWHPEPQWLLDAVDLDKGERRSFALCDVLEWKAAT